jgi:hypothetical protein
MKRKRQKRFSAVTAVKDVSRTLFRDMPKEKRIADKRFKEPRFKQNFADGRDLDGRVKAQANRPKSNGRKEGV